MLKELKIIPKQISVYIFFHMISLSKQITFTPANLVIDRNYNIPRLKSNFEIVRIMY